MISAQPPVCLDTDSPSDAAVLCAAPRFSDHTGAVESCAAWPSHVFISTHQVNSATQAYAALPSHVCNSTH